MSHAWQRGGVHTQILWRQKQPLPVDGLVVGLDVAHRAPFLPWHHLGCSSVGHGRQRCDAGWCSAWLDTVVVVPRENGSGSGTRGVARGRLRGRDTDAGKKESPEGVFEAQAREVIAREGGTAALPHTMPERVHVAFRFVGPRAQGRGRRLAKACPRPPLARA